MFNKEIINDYWKDNKLKFPKTLEEIGNNNIDNIFNNIVNEISLLELSPHEIKFTILPSPDLGLWFSLKWFNLILIIIIDLSTNDLNTKMILNVEDEQEIIENKWEVIKNEIKQINQDINKLKNS